MDNGTALYLTRVLECLVKKIEELKDSIDHSSYTELPTNNWYGAESITARWVMENQKYPKCSSCGYYWREQVVGPAGEGYSDLVEAHFCPNCGAKMENVVCI